MMLIIQIAAGIVTGGLILAFLLSLLQAYYSRTEYEQSEIRKRLDLIIGIPCLILFVILGFLFAPQKTIAVIVRIGTPVILLLTITIGLMFIFRNKDNQLTAFFTWWKNLPKLITKLTELTLIMALLMTGVAANVYLVW